MLNNFSHTLLGFISIFFLSLFFTFWANIIIKKLYQKAPKALLSFPLKTKKTPHLRIFFFFVGFSFSLLLLSASPSYPVLIRGLIASFFLFIIIATDFEQQVIFDRILLPFGVSSLPFIFLSTDKLDFVMAGMGGGILFLLIAILSRGGLGGGDIKLILTLGLWLGTENLIFVTICGFLLGGVVALFLILVRNKSRRDYIAYGPYFALPAWLLLLTTS